MKLTKNLNEHRNKYMKNRLCVYRVSEILINDDKSDLVKMLQNIAYLN